MRSLFKKVSAVVLIVALLVGVLAVPPQNVQAASENYMKGLKLNWDLKKNKTVKFKIAMNVIKEINIQGKITDYKVVDAKKDGYKNLTFTVTFKDDLKKPSNGQIHKMASEGQQAGMDWFSVADYDTGLSLERKNNFNVTVKSSWKTIKEKVYKDNHGCYITAITQRAKVSITYPEEYDGLCIGVGGQNRLGNLPIDKRYWTGKAEFGETSYYKTGKKNSHWMRVRASKEEQPATTSQPQDTETPEPTTSPSEDTPAPAKNSNVTPEIRTIVYDGTNISEIWNVSEPVAVVVNEGVQGIKASAFEGCNNLTSVTLPEGMTDIAKKAFYKCSNLTSITFPESLENIGSYAFGYCSSLQDITLPNSVATIESGVFTHCSSLKSIALPDGLTGIMDETFEGCSSLVSITIPLKVTYISYRAFYECSNLTNIILPESLTRIGVEAFGYCHSLIRIIIPGNVTDVRSSAFLGCDSLINITWRGTTYTSADDFIKHV